MPGRWVWRLMRMNWKMYIMMSAMRVHVVVPVGACLSGLLSGSGRTALLADERLVDVRDDSCNRQTVSEGRILRTKRWREQAVGAN